MERKFSVEAAFAVHAPSRSRVPKSFIEQLIDDRAVTWAAPPPRLKIKDRFGNLPAVAVNRARPLQQLAGRRPQDLVRVYPYDLTMAVDEAERLFEFLILCELMLSDRAVRRAESSFDAQPSDGVLYRCLQFDVVSPFGDFRRRNRHIRVEDELVEASRLPLLRLTIWLLEHGRSYTYRAAFPSCPPT